ncbi:MAG: LysR substrate-binding domain-containing protein [Cytophagales bacterium]|nr:LysR substrate-binding domain-containing protein [Cytophagales bacterium]
MNISTQQLEYIAAIDTYRHFVTASEHCHVTQPTLSMQIKKLEKELDIVIFDRSKQPLVPTEAGKDLIVQVRKILKEIERIDDVVEQYKNSCTGTLKLGIIPTVAPYLVPYFIGNFLRKYPEVELIISELKTDELITALRKETIDAGILATPLGLEGILEKPLYYEQFMCYTEENLEWSKKNKLSVKELLSKKIWVLSEGNCFRNQTFNLCAVDQLDSQNLSFQYESGSIEGLIRLVDREGGSTLIPELVSLELGDKKLERLKFIESNPVREISLVLSRNYVKKKLIEKLSEEIRLSLPSHLLNNASKNVVSLK